MILSGCRVFLSSCCLGIFFCAQDTFLWLDADSTGHLHWIWGFSAFSKYLPVLVGSIAFCFLLWLIGSFLIAALRKEAIRPIATGTSKAFLPSGLLLLVCLQWIPIPGLSEIFLIWGRDLKWFWFCLIVILWAASYWKAIKPFFEKSNRPGQDTGSGCFNLCGDWLGGKSSPQRAKKSEGFVFRLRKNKYETIIFCLCFLVFLGSAFIQYGFKRDGPMSYRLLTGDEPQYLLITQSLVADRDIDLFNNIFLRESVTFFNPETMIGGHGKWAPNHRWYSKHRLGLPLIISPAYYAGTRFNLGIRNVVLLWLCLLAAYLAVEVYRVFVEITRQRGISLLATLGMFSSIPLSIYSAKIFPELLAALFVFMTFRRIWTPLPTTAGAFTAGVLAGIIPWFHERFILVFLVLSLSFLLKERKNVKGCLAFLFPVFISIIFQGIYYYQVNGVPYPLSSTHSGYLNPNGVLNGLFGIWMDQAHGVLPYTPLFVLSFWGFYYFWREARSRTIGILLVMLSIYLVAGGYREWWGGFCPPGRYLVTLVPLLAFPLAYFLFKGPRPLTIYLLIFALLWGAWGAWIAYVNPQIQYAHESFFKEHFFFPVTNIFLPSFLPIEHSNLPHDYLKAYLWMAFVGLGGGYLVWKRPCPEEAPSPLKVFLPVGLGIFIISLVFYWVYPLDLKARILHNSKSQEMALRTLLDVKPVFFLQEGFYRSGQQKDFNFKMVYPCSSYAHEPYEKRKPPEGQGEEIIFITGSETKGLPTIWGQHITLPSGHYKAVFRIKGGSEEIGPVATLEVTRDAGLIIEQRPLLLKDFKPSGTFNEIELPFYLSEETRSMEFRIRVHPKAFLWADTISVEPIKKKEKIY